MQEPNPPGESEIERLLTTNCPATENENLRREVFEQTARLLRRGRRRKRFGFIALLVFCYAAGLGTLQLWKAASLDGTAGRGIVKTEINSETESTTKPNPIATAPAEVSVQTDPAVPAVVLERMGASLNAAKSAAYFRSAGDRYLEVEGDLFSAIRCYKRALDAASEMELGISTEDNWLLMAMKQARQGEQSHAKSDS